MWLVQWRELLDDGAHFSFLIPCHIQISAPLPPPRIHRRCYRDTGGDASIAIRLPLSVPPLCTGEGGTSGSCVSGVEAIGDVASGGEISGGATSAGSAGLKVDERRRDERRRDERWRGG